METPQRKRVCKADRNPAMWGQYRHERTKDRFENVMAKDFHKYWTNIKPKFHAQRISNSENQNQTNRRKQKKHIHRHSILELIKVVVRFNWNYLVQYRYEEKKNMKTNSWKLDTADIEAQRKYNILLGKSCERQKTTVWSFYCFYCCFLWKLSPPPPQSQLQHIWPKCGWSSNLALLNATLRQRSSVPGAQTSSSTGPWLVRSQAI